MPWGRWVSLGSAVGLGDQGQECSLTLLLPPAPALYGGTISVAITTPEPPCAGMGQSQHGSGHSRARSRYLHLTESQDMKGDPQAHRSRSPSCECGPECVPAWPGCPEGISWAWWSQQGRADISSLCRAALLGRAWTVSHPRPPERSGEPGGPEHGEAGMRGAGLGQTPKVGAGRRVGWDVAWGCPPSPAGDEEHWALAMVAEPVCDGFWQRQLIKTGGFTGSRLRQGSGRLSLLCRRWATLPQMWFGARWRAGGTPRSWRRLL